MIEHRPIPKAQQERLAAIIAAKGGVSAAARLFKRDRVTIRSAANGLPVHPYIAEKLAEAIAKRDQEGKNP